MDNQVVTSLRNKNGAPNYFLRVVVYIVAIVLGLFILLAADFVYKLGSDGRPVPPLIIFSVVILAGLLGLRGWERNKRARARTQTTQVVDSGVPVKHYKTARTILTILLAVIFLLWFLVLYRNGLFGDPVDFYLTSPFSILSMLALILIILFLSQKRTN